MKKVIATLFFILSTINYSWGEIEDPFDDSLSLGVVLNYDINTNTYKGTASIMGSLDHKDRKNYVLAVDFEEPLDYSYTGEVDIEIAVDDFFSKKYKAEISNKGTGFILNMNKKLIEAMIKGKKITFMAKNINGLPTEASIGNSDLGEKIGKIRVGKWLY